MHSLQTLLFCLLLILARADLLLQHADAGRIEQFAALSGLPPPTHVHGNYYAILTNSPAADLAHRAAQHDMLLEDANPLPFAVGAQLGFRPPPSRSRFADRALSTNVGWELPLTPNAGIHLNLTGLAERGIDGRGTSISILDDGVDSAHQTFQLSKPTTCSYSLCGKPDDGGIPPTTYDTHGTACAALAVGKTGCNGRGVAPGATLCSVRLLCSTAPTAIDLARGYAANNNDATGSIVSASFGPMDNGQTYYNLHALVWDVLESNMRNKLIHVHAAGNGHQSLDTCAADGTVSNPFVISVGAADSGGTVAYYSEGCPSLTGVAPSNGGQELISALAGRSHAGCTSFGGTSAAAPMVAGIVSLLKQVRPALTLRDARDVLIRTANRDKMHATTFTCNAGGFCHNARAGFGLFDGGAAVAHVSRDDYAPLPPQKKCVADAFVVNGSSIAVMVANCPIIFTEYMFFEMVYEGSLSALRNVVWTTPAGTPAQFLKNTHKYTIANVAQSGGIWMYGEQANGAWSMSWSEQRSVSPGAQPSGTAARPNLVSRVRIALYGH